MLQPNSPVPSERQLEIAATSDNDQQIDETREALHKAFDAFTPRKKPLVRTLNYEQTTKDENALGADRSSTDVQQEIPSEIQFESDDDCTGYAITAALQAYLLMAEIVNNTISGLIQKIAQKSCAESYTAGKENLDNTATQEQLAKILATICSLNETCATKSRQAYKTSNTHDLDASTRMRDLELESVELLALASQSLQKISIIIDYIGKDQCNVTLKRISTDVKEQIITLFPRFLGRLEIANQSLYEPYFSLLREIAEIIHTFETEATEANQLPNDTYESNEAAATPTIPREQHEAALKKSEGRGKERSLQLVLEAEEQIAGAAQEIQALKEKLESERQYIRKLTDDLRTAKAEIEDAEYARDLQEQKMASPANTLSRTDEHISNEHITTESDERVEELLRQIQELQAQKASVESELEEARQQVTNYAIKLVENGDTIKALEREQEEQEEKLRDYIQENEELYQKVQTMTEVSEERSDTNHRLFQALTPRSQRTFRESKSRHTASSPLRRTTHTTPRSRGNSLSSIKEEKPATKQDIRRDILAATMLFCNKLSELRVLLNCVASWYTTQREVNDHMLTAIIHLIDHQELLKRSKLDPNIKRLYEKAFASQLVAEKQPQPKKSVFFSSSSKPTRPIEPNKALISLDVAVKRLVEIADVDTIYTETQKLEKYVEKYLSQDEAIEDANSEIMSENAAESMEITELDEDAAERKKKRKEELQQYIESLTDEQSSLYAKICREFSTAIAGTATDFLFHLGYLTLNLNHVRISLVAHICGKFNVHLLSSKIRDMHETIKLVSEALQIEGLNQLESAQETPLLMQISEKLGGFTFSTDTEITSQLVTLRKKLLEEKRELQQQEEHRVLQIKEITDDKSESARAFLDSITPNTIETLRAICDTAFQAIEDVATEEAETTSLKADIKGIQEKITHFENLKRANIQTSNLEPLFKTDYAAIDRIFKEEKFEKNSDLYKQFVSCMKVFESMFIRLFGCCGVETNLGLHDLSKMYSAFVRNESLHASLDAINQSTFRITFTALANDKLHSFINGKIVTRDLCDPDEVKKFILQCDERQQEKITAIEAQVRGKHPNRR